MSYENTDPAGARETLSNVEGCVLLDVRTPEEFADGHVPGAYNVPMLFRAPSGMRPNPAFVDALEKHFAKDASLVFQ